MNHLQTFEAFGKKAATVDLTQSRKEMTTRRRELMDKMAGIRQKIAAARAQEVNPDVETPEVDAHVEVAEPVMSEPVAELQVQLESIKKELRHLNRLLG